MPTLPTRSRPCSGSCAGRHRAGSGWSLGRPANATWRSDRRWDRLRRAYADISVITDEDPRGEDRTFILEQIAQGAVDAGGDRGRNVLVVPDREEAIGYAIANAAPGDTVLAAGKGHEKNTRDRVRRGPWNERAMVIAAIRRRSLLIGCRFGVPGRRGYCFGRGRHLADPEHTLSRGLRSAPAAR